MNRTCIQRFLLVFAAMTLADLTKRYQEKSEEELLRFAADSLHLTPEARTVLRGELAKRPISS